MEILQWNMNGFFKQKEELQVIINRYSPKLICIQESRLKTQDIAKLRQFDCYRKDYTAGQIACGGVAVFVRDILHHRAVPLQTTLQAVAVSVNVPHKICICNLYLPPSIIIPQNLVEDLIHELPQPFILLGDLNAHNEIWGSRLTDRRGHMLEEIITGENLVLLNTGEQTHLTMANGSLSAIDITICSSTIAADLQWSVLDDTYGSDHFPLMTSMERFLNKEYRTPKWILEKANWKKFTEITNIDIPDTGSIDELNEQITNIIVQAAERTIPKTTSKVTKTPVPWWNKECADAIKKRKKALRKCNRYPTSNNVSEFRLFRARARRIVRESKKLSWQRYVSSITNKTPVSRVWDKIRKIEGKARVTTIPSLEIDGNIETSPEKIVNALAASFAKISSNDNYDPKFKVHKRRAEAKVLNFDTLEENDYNRPFSEWEYDTALSEAKNSAPGQDGIHTEMLRRIHPKLKSKQLSLYNRIWLEHYYPLKWKEAIVIPIYKAGKDKTQCNSYRPIVLTPVGSKHLERMINRRLVWLSEKEGWIAKDQNGFRQHRSTIDNLIKIESEICNAFAEKKHVIAVSFDIEKAYDTAWRYGILRTIHQWGLRGNLPIFIKNFMQERYFRVRMGNELSDSQLQEEGIVQGSVLSVTLFLIAINSIMKNIKENQQRKQLNQSGVQQTIFVDDYFAYIVAKKPIIGQRQLQILINRLYKWGLECGFKFSAAKTKVIHFHREKLQQQEIQLHIGGQTIEQADTIKLLGVLLDYRLEWLPHISDLKTRCQAPLNLMRTICGKTWGAQREVLLRIYKALIRSKLDYAAIVYASAKESHLRRLDPVHNAGIRLATGAFRSSPVDSLYAEAAEPPLAVRRQFLACQHIAKLRSNPGHPTYKTVFRPRLANRYDRNPRLKKPFGIRVRNTIITELDLTLPQVMVRKTTQIPPWLVPRPNINWDLAEMTKGETIPCLYTNFFLEVLANYQDAIHIYTDGSKNGQDVGCAFVIEDDMYTFCIHEYTSVFTSELMAIEKALEYCATDKNTHYVIVSDSKSALQAITKIYPKDQIIRKIHDKMARLYFLGKEINFIWVPSHVGILGNEKADKAAKEAAEKTHWDIEEVTSADLQNTLRHAVEKAWYQRWKDIIPMENKLRNVKELPVKWKTSSRKIRKEEVVLARLRIGHTNITHSYLMAKEQAPECAICQSPLTVQHILEECLNYTIERTQYNINGELAQVLKDDEEQVEKLMKFLKETKIYEKI